MSSRSPLECVNLFNATSGDHGQVYPGAEMPFGVVKLAPDTFPGAVTGSAHAGYDYEDRRLLGFSHLRFSGVGNHGVGGNLLLLPTLQDSAFTPEEYNLPFDKASEQASPGYYHVVVGEPGIRAELTASDRVGVHRYTFPREGRPHVLVDFGRGFTPIRDAHCIALDHRELVGEFTSQQMPPHGWYRMFFSIRFEFPFESIQYNLGEVRGVPLGATGLDRRLAALIRFPATQAGPVLVKVGLSSISVEQARRNIEAEVPDWDFDAARERCSRAWGRVLNRIDVSGDGESRDLLYTHLYRACLSPFDITEDGRYMGDDGEVRKAQGYTHYNGWSIWDTYRTKFPLVALLEPGRTRDMMHSLTVAMLERRDRLPIEHQFDSHGFCPVPNVRYELANTILLDAFQKGIPLHDSVATYGLMRDIACSEYPEELERLGYVPRRPDLTCEYAYDNWAAAEMAHALGYKEDAAFFRKRAGLFRNTWDDSIRFFRARDEQGAWLDFPDDPTVVEEKYVYEGSMWHWRWPVVHAVGEMVELLGGRDSYVEELQYFFEHDLHNHGNEPGVHAPWLFAAAGAPWLSQKWVRMVLTEPMVQHYGTHGFLPEPFRGRIYENTPIGMIPEMDDDDGCMAAWYVFSSMGLFPLCPGRPLYALGAPLFEEVTIRHESGRDFRITAQNWADRNWYVQSARLNGADWDCPWLQHADIVNGGVLELELGPEPNPAWGASAASPW
ncbi:MAG: GH92 family glycosyl hydrolase [Candidatus Hydrogenedentes bacterium]|nr:GH92 family glycosyl hydrolase [Candidatus Hydrogenedentota bacterium]